MKPSDILRKIPEAFKKPTGKKDRSLQLVLNTVIIILVNIAAVSLNLRCDLTRNNTYSLSAKSREVVSHLKENMKIKIFFSENLPAQHMAIYRYLRDLLDEYDYYGNRYFSYEIVGEKDLEKAAADYGIQPVSSQEFADDQTTLRRTYMGVVIQHADLLEKINALTSTVGLEYEITSRMEKMASKIDGLLGLEKPITVRLYLDSRLNALPIRGLDKLEAAVNDAVENGNRRNYNKLVFETVDTSKDGSAEAVAAKYGLNRIQWKGGRNAAGARVPGGEGLLSIVVLKGEQFKVIKLDLAPSLFGNYVVTGLEGLDDSINDTVGSLLGSSVKVGYVTGHGTADLNDNRTRDGAALLNELLSDKYELVPVDLSEKPVPSDISVLIINGPSEALGDTELYNFDQFLMAGNRAILFLDSFNEMQMPGNQNMFRQQQPIVVPVNTGLDDILKHYGVTVQKNIVLDENCTKVNMGQMIKDYPLLPIILKEKLDRESVITKYLNSTAFFKASSLAFDEDKLKEKDLQARTLVSSSDSSWTMTGRMNFNPYMLDMNKPEEMKSYPLAVELSGSFESYFADREVPVREGKTAGKTAGLLSTVKKLDRTIGSGKSGIIVVGTSQITRSGFILDSRKVLSGGGREDEVYSNEHLLHSMVDAMAGNDYVPEMQSKSLAYNPIEKTDDDARFVMKTVNIAGVPIIVILLGLFMWRYRAERRKTIMKEYNPEESDE